MNELMISVRKLVFTAICLRCMLALFTESQYYRYLKYFSYLLMLCIACNIIFTFLGILKINVNMAQANYEDWIKEWGDYMNAEDIIRQN